MNKLEKLEIGDRLYGYYICEAVLCRFELIIKDNKILESIRGDGYITAITGDGDEWFIGLENDVFYSFDKDLDIIFTEKPLDLLNVTRKQNFKLINPKYKLI